MMIIAFLMVQNLHDAQESKRMANSVKTRLVNLLAYVGDMSS